MGHLFRDKWNGIPRIGLLFLTVAAAFYALAARSTYQVDETKGTIVTSDVTYQTDPWESSASFITYRYRAQGKLYIHTSRLSFALPGQNYTKVGTQIPVFYERNHPDRSQAAAPPSREPLLIIASVFAMVGLGVIALTSR